MSGQAATAPRHQPQPTVAVTLERDLTSAAIVDVGGAVLQEVDEVVVGVAPVEGQRHRAASRTEVVHRDDAPVVPGAFVCQHVMMWLLDDPQISPAELGR